MIPNVRVFLSHSSQDKTFARRLAEDLKRHGAKVWLDEAALKPGGRWKQQLDKAISNNDFVIVALTPASIDSEWVKYEIQQALAQGEQKGRIKLIPLLRKKCDVPPELRYLQLVDFSSRDSYRRGLKRLVETLERSWTYPQHQRRPWTKRNLPLALRAGMLREFDGQLVFGARVAERLRTYGARWIRGRPIYFYDHICKDWQEYSGLSVLHAIDRSAGLTDEEEVSLANEAHQRLMDFLLDLGTRAGILEDDPGTVKLSEEMGNEMQEWIPRIEELGFPEETGGELRAATTMLLIELIRERLIERIPEMTSFAEPLGIVIHDTFGFWSGWDLPTGSESDEVGTSVGDKSTHYISERVADKKAKHRVKPSTTRKVSAKSAQNHVERSPIVDAAPSEQINALTEIKENAEEGIAENPDPVTIDTVVHCLESPYPEVQLAAIECLGSLKSKIHSHNLHRFIRSTNPEIQEAAINAIRDSFDRNAVGLLIDALEAGPIPDVRESIVSALQSIGTKKAVAKFKSILADRKSSSLEVQEAIKVLSHLENFGGLSAVLSVDLDRLDSAARSVLAENLAELQYPDRVHTKKIEKILRRLIKDEKEDIRGKALAAWCLNSLEAWDGFLDRSVLWEAISTADEQVVDAFLYSLARYTESFQSDDEPHLLKLVERYPSMTEDIVTDLADMAGPASTEFMKQFLAPDSDHRQSAFIYFARCPSPIVKAECLEEMKTGTHPNTPLLAAVCLARQGDEDAGEFVIQQVRAKTAYPWTKKYALPVLRDLQKCATGSKKASLTKLIKSI